MELKNQLGMQLNANGSITNVTANGQMYQNSILVNELVVAWVGNISDSVSVVFAQSGVQITNPRALIYQKVDDSGLIIYKVAVPSEVMSLSGSISVSLMVRNSANRLLTSGIINVTVNRSMIPSNQETPSTAEDLQSQINVIKDDITGIGDGVAEANAKADLALANSVEAVTTATEAKATAGNALAVATGIEAKADTAIANSLAAIATAGNALTVALGIEGKADLAITTASTATATASQATADVVRLEGEITAFENAIDIRIDAFENSVNAQISALEKQIVEKQGTKVTTGGVFQLQWDSDVKANQVTMDETIARVTASESNIATNTTDIEELESDKSDKSQVALLNCTHSKAGIVHTFLLNSDSAFIVNITSYTVRAQLTANFAEGDTITLTDGVTSYTNIMPLTTDGEPYEVELAVSVNPLVTFNVEGVASGKAFFKGSGGTKVAYKNAGKKTSAILSKYLVTIAPLDKPRRYTVATSTENYAISTGGNGATGDNFSKVTNAYDANLSKTMPAELTLGRLSAGGGTVGGFAVIIGGAYESNLYTPSVEGYTSNLQHIDIGMLPSESISATVVGSYRYLLIAGGRTNTNVYTNAVYSYNNELQMAIIEPLISARINSCGAYNGSHYIIAGGSNPSSPFYSAIVDAYDDNLQRSTPVPLSIVNAHGSGTSVGGFALLGGGLFANNSLSAVVEAYDNNLQRSTLAPLSAARSGIGPVSLDEDWAMFAGGDTGTSSVGIISSKIVDSYNKSLQLNRQTALEVAVSSPGVATVGNYALVMGGSLDKGNTATVAVNAYLNTKTYELKLKQFDESDNPYIYDFGSGKKQAVSDTTLSKSNEKFTGYVKYESNIKVVK